MHDFWTPPLLARAAPDAKLLVMLRDPVERFRSGVPHRLGRRPDHRLEAVTADAIERGKYATQLRRVLAYHDAAKLLVLQYEQCVADPAGQYRRTLAFLGADPDHVHEGFTQQRGTTQAAKKRPLWDDLMAALHAVLDPEVTALAELAPGIDVSLWPNFAHLAAPGAVTA
jgi:Sulfotransferase family